MKEYPILFSGEMIRAILDNRKNQTRRPIRVEWLRCLDLDEPDDMEKALKQSPYGQPGDRLWVREAWAHYIPISCRIKRTIYRVDYDGMKPMDASVKNGFTWKPSIHMPRWASRITLEITEVRVERLQDISLDDVRAEGFTMIEPGSIADKWELYKSAYQGLWDSIYSKRGYPFDSNLWVWVIGFKRINS